MNSGVQSPYLEKIETYLASFVQIMPLLQFSFKPMPVLQDEVFLPFILVFWSSFFSFLNEKSISCTIGPSSSEVHQKYRWKKVMKKRMLCLNEGLYDQDLYAENEYLNQKNFKVFEASGQLNL